MTNSTKSVKSKQIIPPKAFMLKNLDYSQMNDKKMEKLKCSMKSLKIGHQPFNDSISGAKEIISSELPKSI